jgi:hypothetical protein
MRELSFTDAELRELARLIDVKPDDLTPDMVVDAVVRLSAEANEAKLFDVVDQVMRDSFWKLVREHRDDDP